MIRQQFNNELMASTVSNTFPIENLIGTNIQGTSFKDEFRDVFFLYYVDPDLGTCNGHGRPNSRPRPPGNNCCGGFEEFIFNLYLSSLLDDDCLEFYLPNGLTYGIQLVDSSIKSSAHPLTEENKNYGFNHGSTPCDVFEITVEDNTADTIIVVRPYKSDNNCKYYEYPVSDFRDFLD